MRKIKIAIADDHEKSRYALTKFIHLETDIEVVLQVENGVQLLEMLKTVTPDIILMDIRMPKMDGFEASEKVRKFYPGIKIIAFSQYDFEANIIEMNILGVKSFIGKNDDPNELLRAIRIVYDGGVFMTDRSSEIVQRYLSKSPTLKLPSLNDFEKSLLKSICKGQSSTEIGRILNRSHRTIEEHRENLYKKFEVRSKEELIAIAIRRDLV